MRGSDVYLATGKLTSNMRGDKVGAMRTRGWIWNRDRFWTKGSSPVYPNPCPIRRIIDRIDVPVPRGYHPKDAEDGDGRGVASTRHRFPVGAPVPRSHASAGPRVSRCQRRRGVFGQPLQPPLRPPPSHLVSAPRSAQDKKAWTRKHQGLPTPSRHVSQSPEISDSRHGVGLRCDGVMKSWADPLKFPSPSTSPHSCQHSAEQTGRTPILSSHLTRAQKRRHITTS